MGQTRQEKAAREESIRQAGERREALKRAKRDAIHDGPELIYSIDQVESMLIVQAFSVAEHGKDAVPLFERVERDLAALKRAEAILQKYSVHTLADLEVHFERARPMTRKERDAKGVARWMKKKNSD